MKKYIQKYCLHTIVIFVGMFVFFILIKFYGLSFFEWKSYEPFTNWKYKIFGSGLLGFITYKIGFGRLLYKIGFYKSMRTKFSNKNWKVFKKDVWLLACLGTAAMWFLIIEILNFVVSLGYNTLQFIYVITPYIVTIYTVFVIIFVIKKIEKN